jgi:ribonucleotide reductase alpha subunit
VPDGSIKAAREDEIKREVDRKLAELNPPTRAVEPAPETDEGDLDITLRDRKQNDRGIEVDVDRSRDALLTEFGKETLRDRYLMPGESYQDMFARVAMHFADDSDHAQRLYDYISKLWFMPRRRYSRTAARRAVCRSAAS